MNVSEPLKTKLVVPPLRRDLVARPLLLARLDKGLSSRVTLVSAPPGYGKTTLLSEWARGLDMPVAWLSLDEADNDPARFVSHLCASIEAAAPFMAGRLLDLASADRSGPLRTTGSIELFQTALLNELQAAARDLVTVLDDFHLISERRIHELVSFLVDHLPEHIHLVIAARADPPLPLARLRARGHLVEIRQGDLKFTSEEAIALLNQVMGLGLEAGDITALASRTEGWIAGLRLAATSIQARADVHRFIQDFTGSNRYVLDYLVEEVLQWQPDSVQAFLLQTSILDRLTGPLCDAVVGRGGSEDGEQGSRGDGERGRVSEREGAGERGSELSTRDTGPHSSLITRYSSRSRPQSSDPSPSEMLEYLERANLFVVPLDDERRWYRYHRLFADLLQKQLRETYPGLLPELHRRASEWYERNGLVAEAIDHALAAADFERAAQMIERIAEATLMRSEATTLRAWLDALPESQMRTRPSLCVYHAWVLLLAGSPLETIEARLPSIEGQPAVTTLPMRAWAAYYRGNLTTAIELSQQALDQLPEHEVLLRGLAVLGLASAYHTSGDLAASQRVLQDAALGGQESGNVMTAVYASWYQAERCRREGDLRQARWLFLRTLDLATDENGDRLPIAGPALIGLAEIAREWNELDTATHYVLDGINLTGRWAPAAAIEGYVTLARIRQACEDWNGVHEALRTMRQAAAGFKSTDAGDRLVEMFEAWIQIAQSNSSTYSAQSLDGPRRWAERHSFGGPIDPLVLEKDGDITVRRLHKYEYPVVARLRIAEGRPADARSLLEAALPIVKGMNRGGLVIEYQVLIALAEQALGHDAEALRSLEHALAMAEPGGFLRIFVDEGKPMTRLLREAASQRIRPEYVGRLLEAFAVSHQPLTVSHQSSGDGMNPSPTQSSTLSSQFYHLSERELEVLRLVAEGLSNDEIAQRLVVSLPTIKFHTSNIYDKLSVRNRTEAVSRARSQGLLPLA